MKTTVLVLALSLCAALCHAQVPDVVIQTRGSFLTGPDNGFCGEYLNLETSGKIADGFSYVFRQRFNVPVTTSDIFGATDKIYVQYNTGNWEFSVGKVVLECGGYEFDAAPIDVFFAGDYWNHGSGFFNFAIAAARYFGTERVCFQIGRSPLGTVALSGLYSFNLSARGTNGWYSHIWSANIFGVEKGVQSFQQFLGNRFAFGFVTADVDIIHRLTLGAPTFFKDYSVVMNVNMAVSPWLHLFAKAAYDFNDTSTFALVPPGTDLLKVGGGIEAFPIKGSSDLRLHCLFYHDTRPILMTGLTFKFHLLRSKNES